MTPSTLTPESIDRYYTAAFIGLRAVESAAPTDRRFGANADATWKAFKGELNEGDRVDLLLRDASLVHPAAFAPRLVFILEGLAEDEPFGPEWAGPSSAVALKLLRELPRPSTLGEAIQAGAEAWGLTPSPLPKTSLAGIKADSRFWISGPGAILSVAQAFEGHPELDLADQATLVTEEPGERQLFGIAIALLQSTRPARMLTPAQARDAQLPTRAFVSADLSPSALGALAGLPGR